MKVSADSFKAGRFARLITRPGMGRVSAAEGYLVAVASVGVAAILLTLMQPIFTQYNPRFLYFFGSLVFSAWYGGPRAGLVATIAASILNYFVVAPVSDPSREFERWLVICMFALVGLSVAGLEGLRQRAEEALQRERELLEKVFDVSPVMIVLYHPDSHVLRLNRHFEHLTGWPIDEIGNGDFLEKCYPDPAYRAQVRDYMLASEEGWRDFVMTTRDGTLLESSWAAVRLRDDTQVAIGIDIRQRKHTESRVRLLQELTAEFSRAITLGQVADVVIHKAVPAGEGAFGAVYLLGDEEQSLELVSDFHMPEPRREQAARTALDEPLPIAAAVRTGQPIWLRDREAIAASYPRLIETVPAPLLYPASASLPLRVSEQVIGGIYITFQQPHQFSPDEQQFFLALADHCAQAMERARLFESEQMSRQEMEKTASRLSQLQIVTASLSEALTVDQVARIIVDQGMAVLGASTGAFHLLVDNRTTFETRYLVGGRLPPDEAGAWRRYPADSGLPITAAVRSQQALWFQDGDEVARAYPAVDRLAEFYAGAWVILPILIRNQAAGAMSFAFTEARTFEAEEKALMTALAHQCAQALERARLTEQARETAADEERQRLARDLHDAVSQTLFAATTIAESIPRLWERDHQRAHDQIQQLVLLNRAAMAEMRNLLIELRPEALLKTSLSTLLKYLVDAVKGRRDIEVELLVEVDDETVPSSIRVGLYRIAQESVTNILKHSRATRFTVHLSQQESRIRLAIADDGRGFDPDHVEAGLGLDNMRARAQDMGASFEMTTEEGAGTRIAVVWDTNTLVNLDDMVDGRAG